MASKHTKAIRQAEANRPESVLFGGVIELHDLEAKEGQAVLPRFKIEAYDGGLLPVKGFDYPVVVDLGTAQFEKQSININRAHDKNREVGHTDVQQIRATGIYLEGPLSVPGPDRDQVVEASRNGYQWESSIEAKFPPPQFVPKGRSLFANGKNMQGPFYFARNALITGNAILTGGACRTTTVSIAAQEKEKLTMNDELRTYIEAQELDPDVIATDSKLLAHFEAQMKGNVKPKEANVPTANGEDESKALLAQMRADAVAERERLRDINRICAQYNEPKIKIKNGDVETEVLLAEHAINNPDMTIKELTLEAKMWDLDRKSCGFSSPAIHDANRFDKDAQVIECALAMSAGVKEADIERNHWFDDKIVHEAVSSRFRGMRVSRLAFATLQAAGVYHPVGKLDDEYIGACVQANRKLQASGFTTLSLPLIMTNVVNKRLLAAYTRAPSFIPFVFGPVPANDFRPMLSYQLEGSGKLEKLAGDGEIKHGRLVENSYTKQLETYAKMLAFTRKDMINDDLSALQRVTNILGVMAFKAREFEAVQAIVNSGIFSAPNGNLLTSNTFGIAGMTASNTAFALMTDTDGLPIGVDGGNVVVPATLATLAKQLATDTEIRDTTASTKYFTSNPHAGTFSYLASPWFDNALATAVAGVTDADRLKTWYRFANPSSGAAFEVCYLNGVDTPTIQSDETDFNTLGMQWRCYFDFGFGVGDPKFAQKNVGA